MGNKIIFINDKVTLYGPEYKQLISQNVSPVLHFFELQLSQFLLDILIPVDSSIHIHTHEFKGSPFLNFASRSPKLLTEVKSQNKCSDVKCYKISSLTSSLPLIP